MTDIERLLAIEDIKRVKSKYFHGVDHKDWEEWRRDVFTSDISMMMPDAMQEPVVGIDAVIAWVAPLVKDATTVHHGHMPDIDILSDTTAKGVWAMEDLIHWSTPAPSGLTYLHGFGHYHETYERTPAGWRIKTTRLSRLRIETR
jgi:SnoaL-like domain